MAEFEQTNDGTGVKRLSRKRTNGNGLAHISESLEAAREIWRNSRKVVEMPKVPAGDLAKRIAGVK